MLKVVYKDLAVGVEGNVTNTSNDVQDFVDLTELDNQDTNILNYGTLEGNHWALKESVKILPDDLSNVDLGYWSTSISDEQGSFANPITITRTYNGTFTSSGISIEFDTNNNVYASEVNIKWYRSNSIIAEKDFTPNDSTYFFQNNVVAYDKIVFTFTGTNVPSRFLRIFHIYDGTIRQFYKDEIVGLEILENISDIGDEIQINTMNLELISKSPVKMLFQRVQALSVYNDNQLYGTFFVDTSERNRNHYALTTYDLVGMLENNTHNGGLYNNVTAQALITNIMKDIPFELDSTLQSITLSGYLPIETCRNNLMQVAFVLGAVVDTSRTDKVLIYPLPQIQTAYDIDGNKLGIDVTESSEPPYTQIVLYEHSYLKQETISELYKNELTGEAVVQFSGATSNLTISGGTIIESGTNYAIISGTGSEVILKGYQYEDVQVAKTLDNPLNTLNSIPNVFEVQSATLVNSTNSQTILNRIGTALFNNATIDFSFLLDNEKVGDFVNIETDEGTKTGQILSIDYEMRGNKIWCNAKMREVTSGS